MRGRQGGGVGVGFGGGSGVGVVVWCTMGGARLSMPRLRGRRVLTRGCQPGCRLIRLAEQLQSLREHKEELTGQHSKLQKKFDTELLLKNQAQEQEEQANAERIQELEEIVRELEEQNESLKS